MGRVKLGISDLLQIGVIPVLSFRLEASKSVLVIIHLSNTYCPHCLVLGEFRRVVLSLYSGLI
jgi:hypothetical protein